MARALLCSSKGTKLYRNIKSAGILRIRSGSTRCSRRSINGYRYLSASLRATSRSCCSSAAEALPAMILACWSVVAINLPWCSCPIDREREDWQIKRNQDERNKQSHDDQQDRLDHGNHCSQAQIDFFLVELRDTVQHRRNRAARFPDLDHVHSHLWHDTFRSKC